VGFLSYKASLAGVPLVKVAPRNTSRTCAKCGCCAKGNRTSQEVFLCVSCGHRAIADKNAALNIRALALPKQATGLVSVNA
jgi:putative transposase